MKKTLLPLLLLPCLAFGQAQFGLLDTIELEKMQKSASTLSTGEQKETMLTFFMRVDGDAAAARVEAAGAAIDQREGNILVVSAPLSQAEAIAATEGVVTVSLPKEMHFHAKNSWGNDLSRSKLGLTDILNATAPLTQAYTGEGVVVGIVDMGIDVHHKAFLNDDGTHRVKSVWKHVMNGKAVLTITSDTEEKIAKFRTDAATATHGTHVMGIAAGSFNPEDGEYDFRGAAPGADIVVSCGVADNAHLLKGLRSIVDYAKAQGKPCVINMSLGNNSGPHDGTDEFPAALNAIAGEDNVSIFVSAGNEGAYKAFLYKQFEQGETTLKSIIGPSAYTAYLYPSQLSFFPQACGDLEIWSDDDTPFTVSIDMIRINDGKAEVLSSYTVPADGKAYISTEANSSITSDLSVSDDANFNDAYKSSYIRASTGLYAANNRYRAEMAFQLECKSLDFYKNSFMSIRIDGKEGQEIHVYGGSVSGVFPFELNGKDLEGFTESNGNGSINALAGADNVITVGSYVTHNFKPTTTWGYSQLGTTASYTSWGRTPDGRTHPLINAPGSLIVSTMSDDYYNNSTYSPNDQPVYYTYKASDGKEYRFTPMTGTSMASPYMAGVAATWLSADPTLTREDILRIAQETSDTPSVKRVNDGASGHLNAFRGLCHVLGLSGVGNVSVGNDILKIDRAGNLFTVRSANDEKISMTFHNLQGAPVLENNGFGNELGTDASALTKGIYVLSVKAGDAVHSTKVAIY